MRWIVAAALAAVLWASHASAEERIQQYFSDIQIEPDSSIDVAETIDVNVEHDRINHGIFRDIPTRYKGPHGTRISVGLTPEEVTLDGQAVKWSREPLSNGIRIKIGDPDSLVPLGDHRYTIRYRATREIGRFKDYDELYWNVTGTGWIFPIDSAEARVRLPSSATFGQRSVYTGPQGANEHNAEVVSEKPGEIVFRTTQPLNDHEGLTVAAAFPKHLIGDVDETTRVSWWLADYGPPAVGLLGLIGLLGFYYLAWAKAGRNPTPGTIVPLFAPPDDLSPPAMRYVVRESGDNRAFAAALVDMGVRGHIKLVEEEGGFLSRDRTRIERTDGGSALPPEEDAALSSLLGSGTSITMEQKNHSYFAAAKLELEKAFKDRFEGKLFKRNYGWAVAGLLLFVAALWLSAAAILASLDAADVTPIAITVGAFVIAALLFLQIQHSHATGQCLLGTLAFIFAGVALILGFPLFAMALNAGWWLPLIIPALALPFVLSAFWWISAPTKEGRTVLDRIAGFKQYLSITERERLDRMTPPADTPELFERYLPYAIALGVENRWAKRFAGVLAAASAQGQQGFAWYAGNHSPWTNTSSFVDTVGSSLATTVSSASTAPGSSSGSGGGGFSGGGGGGGGGGGW